MSSEGINSDILLISQPRLDFSVLAGGQLSNSFDSSSGDCAVVDLYRRMWCSAIDNSVQLNMAADSGMETCPSPENPDSRKRPLDGDIENGTTKRSHYGAGVDGIYHLKILVPCVASGAIIGKGGETIAQLQKDTNARVKMSKANDFYPGTSERVCLISGAIEAIMAVLIFIMEKIKEKPELTTGGKPVIAAISADLDIKVAERDKQVKILIPNSTAGMIIGKGGAYIKQIKEESGSYVQISQKAKDQTLQERCITIIGEIENNKKACLMILAKVKEDPQSGSCLNVSYADIAGPVANYNPTGSPYAHNVPATAFANSALNSSVAAVSQMMLNGSLGSALNLSLNLNTPYVSSANQSVTSQLMDNIKMVLHSRGYSEHATNEISSAMSTLAKYGILGMGLGLNCANSGSSLLSSSFLGVSPMDATPSPASVNGIAAAAAAAAAAASSGVGGVFGPIGTATTGRSSLDLATTFDPFRHATINNNTFGLGPITKDESNEKDLKKVDLNIPEIIVGAILGPGGRSLVEIQHLSGANIQISKKGIYAPGTRNRVVTISGTLNAISMAQYLIEQRIGEEEAKRTRHNALGLIQ